MCKGMQKYHIPTLMILWYMSEFTGLCYHGNTKVSQHALKVSVMRVLNLRWKLYRRRVSPVSLLYMVVYFYASNMDTTLCIQTWTSYTTFKYEHHILYSYMDFTHYIQTGTSHTIFKCGHHTLYSHMDITHLHYILT